jgi:hypothetical protein
LKSQVLCIWGGKKRKAGRGPLSIFIEVSSVLLKALTKGKRQSILPRIGSLAGALTFAFTFMTDYNGNKGKGFKPFRKYKAAISFY